MKNAFLLGRYEDDGMPLWLPAKSFLRHCAVIGPPGAGKTTLLANLIRQTVSSGVLLCGRHRSQRRGQPARPNTI